MKNSFFKIFCLILLSFFTTIQCLAGDLHFQIYSPDTNTVIKTDLDENDVQNFSRKRDSYGESLNIKFNNAGAVKLKKLTTEHVGKELAIQHLNNEFLFSAKIMEPVNGGEIVITSSDLNFDSLEQGLLLGGLKKEEPLFIKLLPVIGIALIILIFVLLLRSVSQLFKKYGATVIIKKVSLYVFAPLLSIGLLGGVGFVVHKGIENTTLPTCDSKFAEEQVMNIFRAHSEVYQYNYDLGTLGNIEFSLPEPISYDKTINKYECSAKIMMYPSDGNLLRVSNVTYQQIPFIVKYNIYKERSHNKVNASIYRIHPNGDIARYY